jgi:serine protease Do
MDAGPEAMSFEGQQGNLPFPPGSPMERFFKRFAQPDNGSGNSAPRGNPRGATGQGSGFFISADGYAVTNNHVVENASTVQVIADDGKTYSAKVIGTDQGRRQH